MYRKKTDINKQNENFIEENEESPKEKTLNLINNQNRLLNYLILFRIINAICTKTYFNPDEYWQSVEWKEKIRSVAHPLLFATLYKSLAILGLDKGDLFIYAPRIFQAVFAGIGDLYTYRLAKKLFNESIANWALFCSIISWFNFFCSIRMLSNSIETVLTTVALYYWPWPSFSMISWNDRIKTLRVSLTLAAICCILRPTNVIIWGFLGIQLLWETKEHFISIILNTTFITIIAILTIVLIDHTFYGEIVFVPINFLYVNVIQSISLFYGSHPWHWYLSQGIPFITTTLLPFMLKGIYDIYTDKNSFYHYQSIKTLVWLMILVVFGYSLLSHKEFRFIYPLLPIMVICAGYCLHGISLRYQKKILRITVIFLIITNIPLAYYANFVHQRGVVDVMDYLRNEARLGKVREIGFLMPCNSTPFYSNFHFNLSMWYLTCDPPLIGKEIDIENYVDEADQFYANPHDFLKKYFEPINLISSKESTILTLRKWPNYLIIFEALLNDLNPFLKELDYRECARFFNSHFIDDWRRKGDVIVFCRN
ncbi:Glycosyltransferase Family 22 protein [Glomus cerebriforme]|uniref:Mannosyltransferase n=1 Tax=Glomus cerebriforme TaxID=658196 RepID=A0A397TDN4_9GLOM|nr:Glycosyltransferase Family 22 protein [Glomus cerebriforme]